MKTIFIDHIDDNKRSNQITNLQVIPNDINAMKGCMVACTRFATNREKKKIFITLSRAVEVTPMANENSVRSIVVKTIRRNQVIVLQ